MMQESVQGRRAPEVSNVDGLRRLEAALKGRNVEGFSSTIRQDLLLALALAGIMQSVSAS